MAEIERLKPFIEQIKNFAENSFDMFEEALDV